MHLVGCSNQTKLPLRISVTPARARRSTRRVGALGAASAGMATLRTQTRLLKAELVARRAAVTAGWSELEAKGESVQQAESAIAAELKTSHKVRLVDTDRPSPSTVHVCLGCEGPSIA